MNKQELAVLLIIAGSLLLLMALAAHVRVVTEQEYAKQVETISTHMAEFCDDHPNGVVVSLGLIVSCDATTSEGKVATYEELLRRIQE